MILGGGPNRIGQGIEFDYCCCHASFALRELGIESIMVNSNPETVSTDYDTSDLLFFEPLTTEDVLNICDRVQPDGVIVQFGGQTPLNLARALANAGVPIIGTSVDTIEDAEDREKFQQLLAAAGAEAAGQRHRPDHGRRPAARWPRSAIPVLVRPSFVLGGRAMEICYDAAQFERFVAEAFVVAAGPAGADRPLPGRRHRGRRRRHRRRRAGRSWPGIMEHIEEAGVHSGDSACAIPPYSLPGPVVAEIREATVRMARELKVSGLMNVQYAVEDSEDGPAGSVYVLEVNPRASRTVPFVSKATGMPLAKVAAKVMVGVSLAEQGVTDEPIPAHVSVKEAVFPFVKFAGVDIVLGPEMRSTGEVMGISERFSIAFAKSQLAAGTVLPHERQDLHQRGRPAQGARGRAGPAAGGDGLRAAGHAGHGRLRWKRRACRSERVKKLQEGHPNLLDYMADGAVALVMNTPSGKGARPTRAGSAPRPCSRHPLHHHDPSRRRGREGDGSAARRRNDRAGGAGSVCGNCH